MKKTYAEQIADLENTRAAKVGEMDNLMTKSMDEGRSTDDAEGEQIDTLSDEVKRIDADLIRLRQMDSLMKSQAKAVDGTSTQAAAASRHPAVSVQVKPNYAEKGLALAQVAKCLGRAQGSRTEALHIAESAEGSLDPRVAKVLKAAVAVGTTTNPGWAGNLVSEEGGVYADFLAFLRPLTLLGRFGNNGVPALRQVPFRTPLIGQSSGGAGYWVGEGNAKPATSFDFTRNTIEPTKVANIAVVTNEVLRDSSPAADVIIRDQMVAALRERLDIDFIDPTLAAVPGVSPASILNGATAIPSSGTDADAIRADMRALFATFIAANNAPTAGVFIMSATTALALGLMVNPLGQPEFAGIGMNGGTLMGMPVIVTEYVPTSSAGSIVALVNASDIYMADEGGFTVDISREASVQMETAPDNPTTASTVLISLWQRNLTGFLCERTIGWARRRPSAAAYLTGVNWGAGA